MENLDEEKNSRKNENKFIELESTLKEHKNELNLLNKELFEVVNNYRKALDEEEIKELKKKISENE